jgi:hypothetical protein
VGLFFKFPANSPSFPVGRNIVLRSGVFYRVFFFLFHVDIFPRHVFISSALSRASERMCWKTFEELEKEKVRQDRNGRETRRERVNTAPTRFLYVHNVLDHFVSHRSALDGENSARITRLIPTKEIKTGKRTDTFCRFHLDRLCRMKPIICEVDKSGSRPGRVISSFSQKNKIK